MKNQRRTLIAFIAALACYLAAVSVSIGQELDSLKVYREASARFEKEIAAWENRDQTETASESSILFLGSSSIRRWETISEDMSPWRTVGRGYGGRVFRPGNFRPRLLAAHHPRGVAIYVGNDITGKADQDKTPEEIVRLFGIVVEAVKKQAPQAEIFLIAITPAPSRFAAWSKIQAANIQLREFCEKDTRLHFIETHPSYLTPDGQPRPELYVADRLHQNHDGYRIWSGIIRKEFERVFGAPVVSPTLK